MTETEALRVEIKRTDCRVLIRWAAFLYRGDNSLRAWSDVACAQTRWGARRLGRRLVAEYGSVVWGVDDCMNETVETIR